MRSSVLARSRARVRARALSSAGLRFRARALSLGAAVLLAAGFAGCAGQGSSSVKATGDTLTIYASTPSATTSDPRIQDVLDAERLAFQQKRGEVSAYKLALRTIASDKLSDNARTAIQDKGAVAYLGEILPGASANSLGITNAQDLLQVTPTDTALELTQTTAAIPGAPQRYYESLKTYGRTFARVVPTTALEAKAQIQEMQTQSVRSLYVADDGSEYGRAIARAVKQAAAPAITVTSSQTGADAVFYGATSDSAAVRTFTAAAQSDPKVKLFGPSALDDGTFAAGLGGATRNVFISSPGFLPSTLTPAGRKFVADFKSTYQRSPALEAIFGYEAMAALLDVLKQAGSAANDRGTVVRDFFAIRNRSSVLGTYSINGNGDTSIAPFVFSRLRAGKLVPFKFVQPQG
jgi:branched-chain amino acid transport system substrate-binding protein